MSSQRDLAQIRSPNGIDEGVDRRYFMTVDADRLEHGRWIYSAWKHIRRYQSAVASRFGATALAGKAGDLLGRLRMLQRYEIGPLRRLATDAGISGVELANLTLPSLEAVGGLTVDRDDAGRPRAVLPLAFDQDDVMRLVTQVWESAMPESDERLALLALRLAGAVPRSHVELLEACAAPPTGEREAEEGVELAVAVDLIRRHHIADLSTDLYFNEFLWGDDIGRTAEALARLPTQLKEGLVSLLEELHQHEGRPSAAVESASPELMKFATQHGIIEQTEIETSDGRRAEFYFTPRMRGYGVSKQDFPDDLDQIRLVIASFSFAHYHARNRLGDPERFLTALIDRGAAGSAEPIATDYGALEKQQIVATEPIFRGARNHRFVAIKSDALVAARDTMVSGELIGGSPTGQGGALLDSRNFRDPVAVRLELGREPESGHLVWPHRGRLNWPHPVRRRPDRPGSIGARDGGRRRDGIEGGAVRADQARP